MRLTFLNDKTDSFYGRLLGSPVASKGGQARAASLSPSKRRSIAKNAAKARWAERASTKEPSEEPIASMTKHIQFGA